MKLVVWITQDDIDEARRRRENDSGYYPTLSCPTALALKRSIHAAGFKEDDVSVGYNSASTYRLGHGVLPTAINEWIHRFDNREPVAPIMFELTLEKLTLEKDPW